MKKIAIIGYGYVGKAMEQFFKGHYEIAIYDPHIDLYKEPVLNPDVEVICVPTLSLDNGRCNTSIVEEAVSQCKSELIIIKSTVEPGTTDRLKKETGKNIIFSPEYCGESEYWTSYSWTKSIVDTPFFIFGGSAKDTKKAVELYMTIGGPSKKYNQTSAKAAELTKYMENSFFALKLSFVYEMKEICEKSNVDFNVVRELWLLDPRINSSHTAVFSENNQPFEGKCLPKDTLAITSYSEQILNYDAKLLREILNTNKRIGKSK